MIAYADEVRCLCRLGGLEQLAEPLIDGNVDLPAVRRLLVMATAQIDQTTDAPGVVPDMAYLDTYPPEVRRLTRAAVLQHVAHTIDHWPPVGQPS